MNWIAARELRVRAKGTHDFSALTIRVSAPALLDDASRFGDDGQSAAACTLEFVGVPSLAMKVHGMDTLQALSNALSVDGILRKFEERYDFFWPSGEPYFD